jgi:hypothetical protein
MYSFLSTKKKKNALEEIDEAAAGAVQKERDKNEGPQGN